MPTFTPYRFIFSGGRRSRQSRSLYLQKNIAKLGGRSHKHYLWLAEAEPHCQCKGGQSASLRGGVELNIGLSPALPGSASGSTGRRSQTPPERHCNFLALAAQQLHRSTKEMAGGAFICPYGT